MYAKSGRKVTPFVIPSSIIMRPAAYVIMLPLCAAYVVPFRVPLRTSPPTLARHVLPMCREEPAVTKEVEHEAE